MQGLLRRTWLLEKNMKIQIKKFIQKEKLGRRKLKKMHQKVIGGYGCWRILDLESFENEKAV